MKIIVTCGATIEPVDPVRFLSNYSTGYFGIEIARLAKERGHSVILINGKGCLKSPGGVKQISVLTAKDLLLALKKCITDSHALIMAAAVSDFRPSHYSKFKIKRKKVKFLKLTPNPDILKALSGYKKDRIFVGFALETENLLPSLIKKVKEKNLDLIVGQRLDTKVPPFGKKRISAILLDRFGRKAFFREKTKTKVANVLLDKVEELWYFNRQSAKIR